MRFCAKNGFEARGCPGAAEAYDAMYETRFDLILSDIMMPGVDGFDFAETVRELDELHPRSAAPGRGRQQQKADRGRPDHGCGGAYDHTERQ